MIDVAAILAAVLFIGLSGFYSGSETGMYCLNRLRLKVDAEQGDRRALRLSHIMQDEQSALYTLLIGTNLSNYLTTVAVAFLLARHYDIAAGRSELVTTLIVTPIVFVFGEVVPKNVFQRGADHLMRKGSALFSVTCRICAWPVRLLSLLAAPLIRLLLPGSAVGTDDPRRHMALMMREALAADARPAEHSHLIDRILRLKNVGLREVMIPQPQVQTIHLDATRQRCHALARSSAHSRLPVHDDDPRTVLGYVEIHKPLADRVWIGPRGCLRKIVRLDLDQSVASALVALQGAHESIASVENRKGEFLGIVTLKDLLEELTGELHAW